MVANDGYQPEALWHGPSRLFTVRTSKLLSLDSLLDPKDSEDSGIHKLPRAEPVYLGKVGFHNDSRAYKDHQGPDRSVLQYNHRHYGEWKKELASLSPATKTAREALLTPGGFGENFAADADTAGIFMDEHTICVGDIIGIFSPSSNKLQAAIQVTGPRNPCYKLNHRFGIKNMGQRAQESFRTGWLHRTHQEGHVQIGDNLTLLERPYPEWPVARVQYYMYKEPRNFEMIKQCLDSVGSILVEDIKSSLNKRLTKGLENWASRLGLGSTTTPETFSTYRLKQKTQESQRISSFTFERVVPYAPDDVRLVVAEPGSHIRLRFNTRSQPETRLIRPYSIVSGDSNAFTLAIALSDVSRGGSVFLHALQTSETIEASDIFANTFPLQKDSVDRHVFLAGGVGITAFLDHIRYCRTHGIKFELHYMVRNEDDIAFESILRGSTANKTNGTNVDDRQNANCEHFKIYTSSTGNRASIRSILEPVACEPRTHIYTCGSEKLSDAVKAQAHDLNIARERTHFEQFTVNTSGDPFSVRLAASSQKLEVPSHLTLLDVMQEAGHKVPSACEAGNCGTCRIRVLSGRVDHRGTALSEEDKAGWNDSEEGEMLACVSRGIGHVCIDW